MGQSVFNTFPVPAVGGTPAPLAHARDIALRVLVRNAGTLAGQGLVLAYDSTTSLQPTIGSDVYNNLPIGQSDVFVLYPGQKLFAIGLIATLAAVAISDAFPLGPSR